MTQSSKDHETLGLNAPSNLMRTVEAVSMVAGISRDQFILECIKDGVVAMVQDPEYQEKRALLAHNEDVAQYAPADEAAAERVRSINVGRDSAWFKALLDEDNQRRRFTDESM